MKLDDLDHTVQNNVKAKLAQRKPYQGTPLKADHSINIGSMSNAGN